LPAVAGFGGLVVLSAATVIVAVVSDSQRTWANLLVAGYGLVGFGLGAAVFLALLHLTGARWSDGIRRVIEKLTWLLPAGAVGMLVVLLVPSFYPWARASHELGSTFQALWLNRPFFLLRALIYLAAWIGLTWLLVRASRAGISRRKQISALFLVVFAVTFWLASVDWIMSLEPHWSSTIFGVYNFAGMFLAAIAAVVVVAVWFDHLGLLGGRVTPSQWGDLGTLLFGFSSFWMYIWFSQYLLIWYVNNPEETEYFIVRQHPAWQPLFFANLVLSWGVPFLVLLFRPAKECRWALLVVACIVLVGRWLDVYLMVLPPVAGSGEVFGPWDACLIPGTVGLAALLVGLRLPLPSRTASS
jgi:hypothetical protein